MMKLPTLVGGLAAGLIALAMAQASEAQETPPPPPPHSTDEMPTPPGVQPAPPSATAIPYTDAQVASFANAVVRLRALRGDAEMDDPATQAAAEGILMEEGLDPQTFTEMQRAAEADPELAMRIQLAIEAHMAEQ